METAHPYFSGGQYPRVVAHRGLVTPQLAARGVVENTREAIAAGVAAGAHAIESDCHVSADGVAILVHDPDLQRVIGDPRQVRDLTVAQLRELLEPCGGLLTVREALEQFPDTKFQLDVKVAAAAVPVGREIAAHGARVMLTSFSDKRRKVAFATAAAELAATVNAAGSAAAERVAGPAGSAAGTAGSAAAGGDPHPAAKVLPAEAPGRAALLGIWVALHGGKLLRRCLQRQLRKFAALQIPERYFGLRVFSPRLVAAAQQAGVEVHVWTINDPQQMRRLVATGAAGIITDRADLALQVLR